MSEIAIRVQNLSKQYRIGEAQAQYKTLRETLVSSAKRLLPSNLQASNRAPETTIWALKDVSFEIQRGEIVGVIGRNGAGKSTLLKVLAHITSPTKGRVEIHGRVGSLLEVGTGFHNELTGRENIYLNGAILGMKKAEIERKFDEIVDFAEIEKFLDTPVKHYSSGMYMRLAFAVAAHLEPEILLVDEVLAVGDAQFQKKCLGKMGEVAGEGRTVLFVSHQLAMIKTLCNQALCLTNGTINVQGLSENVINYYINSISTELPLKSEVTFTEVSFKKAQILRAGISQLDNYITNKFDIFTPIKLCIQYVIREPITGMAVIIILNKNNETIFVSFDTDNSIELLELREPGIYSTEIILPTPMKAGKYSIDISLGILNGSGIDIQKEAVNYIVDELSFDSSMRSYSLRRPGLIASNLNWNTRKLS